MVDRGRIELPTPGFSDLTLGSWKCAKLLEPEREGPRVLVLQSALECARLRWRWTQNGHKRERVCAGSEQPLAGKAEGPLGSRTRPFRPGGQGEGERRPLAHLALHPDSAPVQLHELLGQRQPEPRPLLLAGVVPADLAELLEDRGLILRRDPDPRVAHGDGHDATVRRHGPDGDSTARRGELHGIGRRFSRICLTFRSSATTSPTPSATVWVSVIPCRVARSRTRVRALSRAVGRWNRPSSSSRRPASTLDRSRMSLIRERRCRPEDRISWRYSACFSLTSPNIRSASTSENPRIAFSGVLSSWDMLARNSDLWRLAASSNRLLSASSRKRRAFWIAKADWVARLWSSATTASGDCPGVRRRTTSRPMRRSSRTSGTTRNARKPARSMTSRTG